MKRRRESGNGGVGDRQWTTEIKRSFMKLAKTHHYQAVPNETECGWLYDMVWFENEPAPSPSTIPPHLREIHMVLESEWAYSPFEILYDFEKLLVAKSPIKVMVFQAYDNLSELWSLLDTGIKKFKTPPTSEKYILAAYRNGKGDFEVKTHDGVTLSNPV